MHLPCTGQRCSLGEPGREAKQSTAVAEPIWQVGAERPGDGVHRSGVGAASGDDSFLGNPGLGQEVVDGAGQGFRGIEQRRVGGDQGDPAAAATVGQRLVLGVGAFEGLQPVQGQAKQAGRDPTRRGTVLVLGHRRK